MIERVEEVGGSVWIWAHPRAVQLACPGCGGESARVHSRYARKLADAAVAGRRVEIRLRVRRFFCDGEGCGVRAFVEQVAGLTTRHGRCTVLLRGMLESIGLALAGQAGARLATALGLPGGCCIWGGRGRAGCADAPSPSSSPITAVRVRWLPLPSRRDHG
ncbi:MAG: transposase family protein, partial [Actinomycetota bacterium]|nr:transposase family protein [Actinomycetota bacterium]